MTSRNPRLVRILAVLTAPAAVAAPPPSTPVDLHLTGLVRDFRARTVEGGHPDFENLPAAGAGRYAGGVALTIAPDGRPVYAGGIKAIDTAWLDGTGQTIAWCMNSQYPTAGDVPGVWGAASGGGIVSGTSFSQWFHDAPVFNMSAPATIILAWDEPSLKYVFDDQLDPSYAPLGGFFPIDDQLFGDSPPDLIHNFHFTFELHTQFMYQAAAAQRFRLRTTNADSWTFVDGHLVTDLIGVQANGDQFVDLNRLGLLDGDSCSLDLFFAQRFRPASHLRIETNIPLQSLMIQTVSAVFD